MEEVEVQIAECMNNIISLWTLFCLCISSANAQTYYYKLTKEIKKGLTNTNVKGGQFITFEDEKCFESNKFGESVGNGVLKYNRYYSSQYKTYTGTCYYGQNAFFRFNSDKSLLNIETNAGKIYVYRRTTPPAGITTCSLIRKSNYSNSGFIDGYSSPPNSTQQPVFGGEKHGGTSLGKNEDSDEKARKQTPTKHQCSLCNGTGKIIREYGTATFGTDSQVYCSICGRSYFRSTGHSHVTCPTCHGKGWY